MAACTAGFSGAELEQVVAAALYAAFAAGTPLTTPRLLAEVTATRPLSQTMGERLGVLREWARGRTVTAA